MLTGAIKDRLLDNDRRRLEQIVDQQVHGARKRPSVADDDEIGIDDVADGSIVEMKEVFTEQKTSSGTKRQVVKRMVVETKMTTPAATASTHKAAITKQNKSTASK